MGFGWASVRSYLYVILCSYRTLHSLYQFMLIRIHSFWCGGPPRHVDLIQTWVERAYWIDLVHAALRGDRQQQSELAEEMALKCIHLNKDELEHISYTDALRRCKAVYMNVPRKNMSPSLLRYLELKLNYLTPGVVLGVSYLVMTSRFNFNMRWIKSE